MQMMNRAHAARIAHTAQDSLEDGRAAWAQPVLAIALACLLLLAGLMLASCGGQASNAKQITVSVTIDGTEGGKGTIYDGSVQIPEGGSVYDALLETGVDMKVKSSSAYVESIGGLAEKEQASTSGWIYRVNGEMAGVMCSEYKLNEGDKVSWTWYLDALNVKE